MNYIEKHLEITLRAYKGNDGTFDVEIYEPETGSFSKVWNFFHPDEHPEFDGEIGAEIYEWLSMLFSEMEDEK